MRYTKSVEGAYDRQTKILDGLYELFPVGEEQHGIQLEAIGQTIGGLGDTPTAVKSSMIDARDALVEAGIVAYHRAWIPGQKGRKSHLTLLVPKHEAKELLDKWQKARLMKPTVAKPRKTKVRLKQTEVDAIEAAAAISNLDTSERTSVDSPNFDPYWDQVAVSDKDGEEVKAIAGPDRTEALAALAPLRRDESYALITAARQYAGRRKAIKDKIKELRDAGISLKIEIEDAFDFDTDDRLESVSLVLPYLDQIERHLENALRRLDEHSQTERQLKLKIEGLNRELRRHQAQPTVAHAER